MNVRAAAAKTKVSRSLPISPITDQAIGRLMVAYNEDWKTDLVFCTYEGQPINRKSWSRRMMKYSKKVGVKVRPYDLRYSFTLYYLRADGDVFSLQRILGHTNLTMTQKYLALTGEDIQKRHAKSTPLNTLTRTKRVKKI